MLSSASVRVLNNNRTAVLRQKPPEDLKKKERKKKFLFFKSQITSIKSPAFRQHYYISGLKSAEIRYQTLQWIFKKREREHLKDSELTRKVTVIPSRMWLIIEQSIWDLEILQVVFCCCCCSSHRAVFRLLSFLIPSVIPRLLDMLHTVQHLCFTNKLK